MIIAVSRLFWYVRAHHRTKTNPVFWNIYFFIIKPDQESRKAIPRRSIGVLKIIGMSYRAKTIFPTAHRC